MKDKSSKFCGCLYFTSNALARNVTRMADEAYAPTGLAPSHAMLLMAVIDAPGINPTELAEIMLLSPSTVTRLVEKLEQKGLVLRQSNGKFTEVYPTEAGTAMRMKITAAWMDLYRNYTGLLGEPEAGALAGLAYKAAKTFNKV
jgi:MarR family transcriptional regulator, organic hydroperoxide resistance regulator